MSNKLFDVLQSEYCPPLDTSLLAALIADLPPDNNDGISPSPHQVAALRATLKELASQATEQYESELRDELDSAHLSSQCFSTDESCSSPGYYGETAESLTSESSVLSNQSFSSPLGFLQAALPHIPSSKLRRALSEAGSTDVSDVDMESIMENILTNEYIRELEERGLDGLDDEDPSHLISDDAIWHRMEPRKKVASPSTNGNVTKKKNVRNKNKTIPLVDIRQRQHIPSPARESLSTPAPDMWTQVSSISEHLATLLPSNPPNFFQSYFHSPKHTSPVKAVRAALSDIAERMKKPKSPTPSPHSGDTLVLFNLLDVICESPTYARLNPPQRSNVYSDVQLALSATQGRGDNSLDIVWLLLELELDGQTGSLAMGVYHLPQPPLSPSSPSAGLSSPVSPSKSPIRVTNAMSQSPPTAKWIPHSPTKAAISNAPDWQTVASRKPPPVNHRRSLSLCIPSYGDHPSGGTAKVRGAGNGFGKGGKGDVGELTSGRRNMRRHLTKSWMKENELLREASRAWRSGNAKSRGGEIAQYFAERARETRERAKREALDEARRMVETKRYKSTDSNTLDIHGTNVWEATTIVKEVLQREGCTPSKPLRIITGRGNHSANRVGVLKPAVKNALVRDGWNVSIWEGGLVVRGRGA
ncbi:hypothetical protein F5J12DRAFT_822126 [Pisolithus orientalis]|uniref:uncharacterized protein n=1 Tax=Pisolithus orientalis TaxID=936130 RepID=UPI0022248B8A|nr:uncharacterized protein F5J12DRAFT_822126 [Pisolithus orientalis]KAI6010861.1 hypothetical protein F5J12DRAFT_822126 [Pisolithus orientalis]